MEKITLPQPESRSADLVNENVEQLKQIFPEVIKEGRVDLEALHDLLGNYVDTPEERFGLNWAGKANARREAQKRSTGTLRPCPEESVDWETTENLYIEGDNLEVLKLLQKSYHKQVKMIYIDPPYNTGKDFVYKDNYNDNLSNYLEQTGQDRRLSTKALSDSDGRYHSNWLNMMYPRLKLARNLLTDDGVIFISIDDNEVDNLRKVCDEIFGEENFVAQLIWERAYAPKNDARFISNSHDYILMYAKQISTYKVGRLDRTEEANARYLNPDNDPRGVWKSDNLSVKTYSASCDYPITTPSGRIVEPPAGRCWSLSRNVFLERLQDNRIWFGTDGNSVPSIKRFLTELKFDGMAPISILFYKEVGHSQEGTQEVIKLLNAGVFDGPKPVRLLRRLLTLANTNSNSIILDFFSGSATTAHAVMQLNAENGGNRKYICVQIPEATPEDSEARKAGFNTIPEIAKERIRRAGKKILEEQKEKNNGLFAEETSKLDIGFKVFKLDSSNVNAWDSNPDHLEEALNNSLFNIKEDRTEDDLLYEILIKYGIELTEKINRHTIAGGTVYEMGAGSLIVCLADNLSSDVAEGIGELWNEVCAKDENVKCRVVFKDSGFNGSDEMKTNTMLILKQHGITNVASV
ncbi:MAG: site-specific DNA-methyltransferase [Odoribacter sp.]